MAMTTTSMIARQRLANQLITDSGDTPADVVRWMGMVQAQDYLAALWAIGLRTKEATEIEVEKAIAERSIIRTWPARGTLHFVVAEDVHWMLELLAPRVISRSAGRYQQLGLDEDTFSQSGKLVRKVLQGGNHMTRPNLLQELEKAHISTAGQRGIHIIGRLAMEGLICFGTREGKQQTFVLLDEWVPRKTVTGGEWAMAELARRYFTSHGPATLYDFAWWSGQTITNARAGLEMAESSLSGETIDGQTYWRASASRSTGKNSSNAYLLPAFDEYLVGYQDRSAVLDPGYVRQVNAGGGMLSPVVVIDGQVAGTWKRKFKKETVEITPNWFGSLTEAQLSAFTQAAQCYANFHLLEVSFIA